MNFEDGMSDEVLAIFKKFGNGGGQRRGPPGAGKQPPAANGSRPVKCANCLRDGHTAQECKQPKVDQAKRLCFERGLPNHQARNCPTKGKNTPATWRTETSLPIRWTSGASA